ncbi:MAG: hypothetical protein MI802_13085 [Desulfobacterales bacterium]|nr:hypothetical protein [Desulfobacterales bacterium]
MNKRIKNRPGFPAAAVLATLIMVLLAGAAPALAGGGDGYNSVTIYNCTKGDGVSGTDKDIGVLYLTMKSYNAWDDEMKWAFTAVGQTGVVQNVDPGESATLNCLQKENWFSSTTYNSCKVLVTKTSFPDSLETLSDGNTYYFTGLSTSDAGTFETSKPSYCD